MSSLFIGRLVMAEEPGWYLEGPHSNGLFALFLYGILGGTEPRDSFVLCSFTGQKIQVHTWSFIQAGLSEISGC